MTEIKNALWSDYNKVSKNIEELGVTHEKSESLLEERDKIRNELIKLEQVKVEAELKQTQIEAENKREKIRNCITIGTFAVSTGISFYGIRKTFRFDEGATVTSTLGRGILNNLIPKMFKR